MAEWSKAIGLRLIGAIRRRFKSYSPQFLFIRALPYFKLRNMVLDKVFLLIQIENTIDI